MSASVPIFRTAWAEEDIDAMSAVVRRGTFWTEGEEVLQFEQGLCATTARRFAVTFCNGTEALFALLSALGIGRGDEVIVPSFTFIATANAPLFVDATPVFADIEEQTLGLDPADVAARVTPRTKAIIPINYGGQAAQVDTLEALAHERGIPLLEDTAETLGTTLGERRCGSFGTASLLSFCANKVISTAEGGAIVTDDGALADRLRLVRSHGRELGRSYFTTAAQLDYITLGHNLRMSSITAALGLSQLRRLSANVAARQRVAARYAADLSDLPQLQLPQAGPKRSHCYQLYSLRVRTPPAPARRDALSAHLSAAGIGNKVYFPPVHLTSHFRSRTVGPTPTLPVTQRVSAEVLALPIFPGLTSEEQESVSAAVRAGVEQFDGEG